jgi:aryl-alcohol dehydrogenase
MTSATAAVVESFGALFTLEQADLDEPRPGEALVRMVAVGVCATDMGARAGLPSTRSSAASH